MASTRIYSRPTNGVSFGLKHVVTAADVAVSGILFDFRTIGSDLTDDRFRYDLAAIIQVTASGTNVVTIPANLAITYPYKGTVEAKGTFVAGSTIIVLANPSTVIS
jgi:hypothetical protein